MPREPWLAGPRGHNAQRLQLLQDRGPAPRPDRRPRHDRGGYPQRSPGVTALRSRQLHQRLLAVAISSRPNTSSPNSLGSALHPLKRSGTFAHSRSTMRRLTRHAEGPEAGGRLPLAHMKASRSAATLSGRSQLGLWPVAGYTTTLAPGMATASWSSSSRRPRTAVCNSNSSRCRPAIPGRRSAPAGRHARGGSRPHTGRPSSSPSGPPGWPARPRRRPRRPPRRRRSPPRCSSSPAARSRRGRADPARRRGSAGGAEAGPDCRRTTSRYRRAERRSVLHSGRPARHSGPADRWQGAWWKTEAAEPVAAWPPLWHSDPAHGAHPTAARAKQTRDAIGFLPWRSLTTPERALLRLIWLWLAASGPRVTWGPTHTFSTRER
jgi:hypothetical protein